MPTMCSSLGAWAQLWVGQEGRVIQGVVVRQRSRENLRRYLLGAGCGVGGVSGLGARSTSSPPGGREGLALTSQLTGYTVGGLGHGAGQGRPRGPNQLWRETVAGGRAHRKPGAQSRTAATCSSCSGRYVPLPGRPPPARLLPTPEPRLRTGCECIRVVGKRILAVRSVMREHLRQGTPAMWGTGAAYRVACF